MLGLLYSLMLAGCSQSGASMMGSVGSIKKQSNYEKCCKWIKDILHRIGVSYPIIVEYKIVGDQLKREHTCKYKQDCGLDKHQWEIEKKIKINTKEFGTVLRILSIKNIENK
ncbi:hypothetical protein [Cardinium endosymbiont of Sogatella furcifera]|uniref:hypothetical protein n=1 Tax=Cardinium endosymbiont of Sogatella furcifera TaxID=650378 RepID=UPI000E0D1E8E|nr:hypothetical protein [Cardinium endosymbiont of Sogatella furcifera]